MAKSPKRSKPAAKLTSDDVMNRVFGKGAAKKLHALVEREDALKGKKRKRDAN